MSSKLKNCIRTAASKIERLQWASNGKATNKVIFNLQPNVYLLQLPFLLNNSKNLQI
jgi:hypothetical protein